MNEAETITSLTAGFGWQTELAEIEQAFALGTLDVDSIRREFEEELWPNITKTRNWCVEQAKTDARAAILCSKLAGCAGSFLDKERGRQVLIEWREDAVDAIAATLGRRVLPKDVEDDMVHDLMGHLTYLGFLHMANGNMDRARAVLERTLSEGNAYDSHFADKVAFLHLAMVDIRQEKLDDAIANLDKALERAQDGEGAPTRAAAHNLLGVIASSRNDPKTAASEYDQAAVLFEAIGDRSGQGTVLANLSGVLLDLGRRQAAESHLKRAESIAKELNSPSHSALCLVNRARTMIADGCTDSSAILELLDEALSHFTLLGDIPQIRHVGSLIETLLRSALETPTDLSHDQRSYALRRLGELASSRGDRHAQINLMQQLLTEAQLAHDDEDELLALGQLGHANLLQAEYAQAALQLEEALKVLDRFPNRSTLAKAECEIRLSLGQCRRHLDDPDGADHQYSQAQHLATWLGDTEALSRAVGNRALLKVDVGDFDTAIASLTELVATIRASGDLRLTAHARFNLAFAAYRKGDLPNALKEGKEAEAMLDRIGDESADEVRRQMGTWIVQG